VQKEQRQKCTLPRSREANRLSLAEHLERPEDPELHARQVATLTRAMGDR
jgi:hypothetical protein